jgi:hypothetical protein
MAPRPSSSPRRARRQGNNSFEIAADRGRLVLDNNGLKWQRTQGSVQEYLETATGGFDKPEVWDISIPGGTSSEHKVVTTNFVQAIRGEAELTSPGLEGINGLNLSNAMHLSAWTDDWVSLPVDEEKYLRELKKRIKNSTAQKKEGGKALNFGGTF